MTSARSVAGCPGTANTSSGPCKRRDAGTCGCVFDTTHLQEDGRRHALTRCRVLGDHHCFLLGTPHGAGRLGANDGSRTLELARLKAEAGAHRERLEQRRAALFRLHRLRRRWWRRADGPAAQQRGIVLGLQDVEFGLRGHRNRLDTPQGPRRAAGPTGAQLQRKRDPVASMQSSIHQSSHCRPNSSIERRSRSASLCTGLRSTLVPQAAGPSTCGARKRQPLVCKAHVWFRLGRRQHATHIRHKALLYFTSPLQL